MSTLSGVQRSTCLESLPTLPTFAPHLTMDSASPEPQGADGVIAGSPSDFLKNIVGHRVKVRIGSGVDYHGESGRPCPGGGGRLLHRKIIHQPSRHTGYFDSVRILSPITISPMRIRSRQSRVRCPVVYDFADTVNPHPAPWDFLLTRRRNRPSHLP